MIRSVAITGATGFIGRHVAADLLARGITVKAVIRPRSPHAAPPGTVAVTAPLEAAALREAFAGVDAVVHLAGVVAAVSAVATLGGAALTASRRTRPRDPRTILGMGSRRPRTILADRGR